MKHPHRLGLGGILLAAAVGLSASCPAQAAEISSSLTAADAAPTPSSHYKKKIPGSTNKIKGSRPRTYLKPKKQSYQEHMDSLKKHRFKNESTAFGYRTKNSASGGSAVSGASSGASAANASPHAAPGRTLTSSRPPSSRVQVQQRIGRPAPGMSRSQPLSANDHLFLGKLTETVRPGDSASASRLESIAAGQKQGRTLTKDEYDFLQSMSGRVQDGQAAYRLRSIAEKRREAMY